MSSTIAVRVSKIVREEVNAVARLLGCSAADLMERAWAVYRQSPEFEADFNLAQKAFSSGDLSRVAAFLHEQAQERRKRKKMLNEQPALFMNKDPFRKG